MFYIPEKIETSHIHMATKFDNANDYTVLVCELNYDDMVTTTNKKKNDLLILSSNYKENNYDTSDVIRL